MWYLDYFDEISGKWTTADMSKYIIPVQAVITLMREIYPTLLVRMKYK
jgi:hypothetical protein